MKLPPLISRLCKSFSLMFERDKEFVQGHPINSNDWFHVSSKCLELLKKKKTNFDGNAWSFMIENVSNHPNHPSNEKKT